jgi:hypothetical protein
MHVVFGGTGATATSVSGFVPASFPLNTGLSSASVTINNTKLTVQSQDICEILNKQYDQKFLSKPSKQHQFMLTNTGALLQMQVQTHYLLCTWAELYMLKKILMFQGGRMLI